MSQSPNHDIDPRPPRLRIWLSALTLVLGISLVYHRLVFVGSAFIGAGHGPSFFLEAVIAPFLGAKMYNTVAMVAFWPLVSILLALRRFPARRIAAAFALLVHYVGILAIVSRQGWDDKISQARGSFPVTVSALVGTYLISQVLMWVLIARKKEQYGKIEYALMLLLGLVFIALEVALFRETRD